MTLKTGRVRVDLIEVFNILNELELGINQSVFTKKEAVTRGHALNF